MRERRQFYRISEDCRITYKKIAGSKSNNQLGRDISKRGLRFFTNEFLAVGTVLRLEIALEPSKKILQVAGQVRWIRSVFDQERFEVGIEFTEISAAGERDLSAHIKSQLLKE